MQIDRRITNGLAWAGALLVVAIPAADGTLRQFSGPRAPTIAVLDEQALPAASMPTPATERPQSVAIAEADARPAEAAVAPIAEAKPALAPAPDPVTTAAVNARVLGNDAVDSFLQSGRELPSYISDRGSTEPAEIASPEQTEPVAASAPEPAADSVATVSRTRFVTFPTPVSERPVSVPRSVVAASAPLIVETPDIVVTAQDLEDWESGPLSEFLARRQSGGAPADMGDYDPDGFFLDQGPNSRARVTRFPRTYGYDAYSFE
ncbi:hypothetical protein [Devosia sp. XK-2]|uniref:hypothetical protein n=1 Tax=Devosia sp. XK-2 TaxID=3126689 RepID=UPI0030CB4C0D